MLLFLSASINVAFAWWAAVRPITPLLRFPSFLNHRQGVPVDGKYLYQSFDMVELRETGLTWRVSTGSVASTTVQTRFHTSAGWEGTKQQVADSPPAFDPKPFPSWSRAAAFFLDYEDRRPMPIELEHGDWAYADLTEYATGFPLRSMEYSILYHGSTALPLETRRTFRNAWILSPSLKNFLDPHMPYLPLRPLPLGFAVNTLFYAALILLPWEGFGWARRARRRRRGLCTKCAHSLEGLPADAPCPECGTAPKA